MQYRSIRLITMSLLLPMCCASGCGNGLNLQAVSGRVTLDSRPLENGTIEFSPADRRGLVSGSVITAGEYRIPRDKGLPHGKYTVRISSADGTNGRVAPPRDGAFHELVPDSERIPARYNSASQLSVEITSNGKNVFDFDLNSRQK